MTNIKCKVSSKFIRNFRIAIPGFPDESQYLIYNARQIDPVGAPSYDVLRIRPETKTRACSHTTYIKAITRVVGRGNFLE